MPDLCRWATTGDRSHLGSEPCAAHRDLMTFELDYETYKPGLVAALDGIYDECQRAIALDSSADRSLVTRRIAAEVLGIKSGVLALLGCVREGPSDDSFEALESRLAAYDPLRDVAVQEKGDRAQQSVVHLRDLILAALEERRIPEGAELSTVF